MMMGWTRHSRAAALLAMGLVVVMLAVAVSGAASSEVRFWPEA